MLEWRSLESNIWKIHLRSMLASFTLFTPVLVLFFQENGLSMTEVTILQSAYSVAVILLEVPSGYFADLFGRRTSLTISGIFLASGIGVYSLGTGFYDFLLGELIFAVGGSLESGSASALIYDTLEDLGKEDLYQEIWGKTSYYSLMSVALASILGGFIGDITLRATLFGMIPFYLILAPLSLSLREPRRHEEVSEEASKNVKGVFEYCIRNKRLRWLIIYSAVIAGSLKAGYFLYQPYFKITGLDVSLFGLVFAGLNVISAISSHQAHKIEEILGQRNALISLMVVTASGFFLMGHFLVSFAFLFAGLHNIVRGASKPIISDYINGMVSSDRRSTFLSTKNLVSRILYAMAFPIIGVITDSFGYQEAFMVLGVTVIVAGTTSLFLLKLSGIFTKD